MATKKSRASRAASRPSGTVTFLFSDIEGSTQRWERDRDAMTIALSRHDALMRDAIERHGGYVFKTIGDAFCAVFTAAPHAIGAAIDAQRALAAEEFSAVDGMRVRMAVHTGSADERDHDYFGPAVNRVARLLAIGHGGQVLASGTTADLAKDELPAQSNLRDLGTHQLKDLAQPERVYQLVVPDLPQAFPALRSLGSQPNNLPRQLTSFVGRADVLQQVAALLNSSPLVTLVGTGGVGKTRAAIQAGSELLESVADGVWLVELAPISDASLVGNAVAQALSVQVSPKRPVIETLVDALKNKRLLLILDNCEHVIDEARAVVTTVLHACPDVRILATSREAFGIAGENVYRMPSLEDDAAVALFAERARSSDEHFALTEENARDVAEICRRLDGIPLAIELAAARAKLLAPRQLAQKLDERFRLLTGGDRSALPRQQTMRALIDWSYDLLSEQERAFFRRLSVFAGSFTLESAAAVCESDALDDIAVLDVLASLVDKSLVSAELGDEATRYRLLESTRQYARERLLEEADAEVRDVAARHVRYYAELVGRLAHFVDSLDDEQWQQALGPELDNIRAALDWSLLRSNDGDAGLRLLAHLSWPDLLTSPQEAIRWFDAAASAADADQATRARVLRHHSRLQWLVGRPTAEREKTATEALAAARACADPDDIALALTTLGSCYRDTGRFGDAEPLFAEAYREPHALKAPSVNAILRNWAVTDLQRGAIDSARLRFTEVAALERPGSEAHASALLNLGELEFAVGNVEAARNAAREASAIFARLNSAPLALAVCNLAAYALAVDDVAEAREQLQRALRLLRQSGARWMTTALEHHAVLAGLAGDHERAATLLGFTEAQYAANDTRQRTEQHGYERLLALLTHAYGAEELSRRMAIGARLDDEQALAYAAAISQDTP